MATTYGWLYGKAQTPGTRCGGKGGIDARVQTWKGGINVHLSPDGQASIEIDGEINAVVSNNLQTVVFSKMTAKQKEEEMKKFDEKLEKLSQIARVLK